MSTVLATFFLVFLFPFYACDSESADKLPSTTNNTTTMTDSHPDFNQYWYSGNAELNSYALKQSRYGEMRDGEVVLVFVTEPFSESKQVKLDYPKMAGKDKVPVMKLNQVRKFSTGIYDYSIMTSTFTPVDTKAFPHTLKSTTSVQEWCGHTYTQLNLQDGNYQLQQYSYFESEGDETKKLSAALLEDELMTRIRISDGRLPEGQVTLIPSTLHSRLGHKALQPSQAVISKSEEGGLVSYTISYQDIERKLTIEVEKDFPYKIRGWSEDTGDGLVTTATLKKSITEPYWSQHDEADKPKRAQLGLMH